MINQEESRKLLSDEMKKSIIDAIILAIILSILPFLILSVFRFLNTGWKPAYTYQIVLFAAFILLFVFRKRIGFQIKTWTFICLLFLVSLNGVVSFGILSRGYLFFIFAILIAGLFIGRNTAIVLLCLSVGVLSIMAFLYRAKILDYNFDVLNYIHNPLVWFLLIYSLAVITLVILIINNQFINFFINFSKKLQEGEKGFRLIIENIPAVTWISNSKGETTYISPNVINVYGYTQEEIINSGEDLWFGRIHPGDLEKVKSEYQKLFENNSTYKIEYRIQRKDGKWIWIYDKANISEEIGGIKYAYGVFSDISREKESETEVILKNQELMTAHEDLRLLLEKQGDINAELEEKNEILKKAFENIEESEIKYHSLFEHANDAIFLINDHHIVECNRTTIDMFCCEKDYIINKTPFDISPEYQANGELSKDLAIHYMDLTIQGKPQRFEWTHLRQDKSTFFAEISLNDIHLGHSLLILAIVRDITERKKAELKLIESERNFRNIFDSSSDGILIADMERNIINANKVILDFMDCTLETLCKYKTTDFVLHEHIPLLAQRRGILLNGGEPGIFEINMKNSKGISLPVEIRSSKINYKNSPAVLSIIRDISERKKTEQRIINAIINTEEKERTRFAKELHDGLGPILSTVKLYYQWLSETEEPEKRNTIILKGAENIDEAIITLREISNNLSPHMLENFGLSEAIEMFAEKISASKKIAIQYHSNVHERFPREIEITLYRVITELINNTLRHGHASEIKISFNKDPDLNILNLEYHDNGIGFNSSTLLKNKTGGHGLFNIKNRINTIGGIFRLSSRLNKGMAVSISINLNKQHE